MELGRTAEARAIVEDVERRGLTWGARPRSRYLLAEAKLTLAESKDANAAIALGREAVAVLAGIEAHQNEARAREVLGDLLAESGDAEAAAGEWKRAAELYAVKEYRPGERRVRAKLSRDKPRTAA